ncbi:hypothetical protein ACFYON_07065 [Micromonospora sp. NPDC005686]|uniref:hypothetical protein n=1 Tax=unclassified Micromonospora TaxID=2617518 RepID=UPI0036C2C123
MAGVASPMLRRNVSEGLRFLAGLAVGGLVAGMVLAVPVYLIGSAVGELVPETWRVVALVALAVLFGVLDLLDRTPHIWRQVPQRLVRSLPAGTLGVVWGIDLGLLFTTQKTTSLIWLATAGVVLVAPGSAPLVLVVTALTVTLLVTLWSLTRKAAEIEERSDRLWVSRVRRVSGAAMLLLAAALAVTVVSP